MKGIVYILLTDNNRYYVGSTNDIKRRMAEHDSGENKATRYVRPVKLLFTQSFNLLTNARKIEYRLKKLKRRDIIERIIKDKRIKLDP